MTEDGRTVNWKETLYEGLLSGLGFPPFHTVDD